MFAILNVLAIGIAASMLCSQSTMAQTRACGEILKHGLWDNHFYSGTFKNEDIARDWYCNKTTEQTRRDRGLSYIGNWSGSATDNSSKNASTDVCSENYRSQVYSAQVQEHWRKASADIVKAWSDCVGKPTDALNVWIEQASDDGREFFVSVVLTTQAEIATPVLRWDFGPNVTCAKAVKSASRSRQTFRCNRKAPNQPVTIEVSSPQSSINGSGGSGIFKIPPVATQLGAIPLADRVCLRLRQGKDPTGTDNKADWKCADKGNESEWVNFGDDSKPLVKQFVQIISNTDRLCFQHRTYSPTYGWQDTGWVCSQGGVASRWQLVGDDTGWKPQLFRIRTGGQGQVCFQFSRHSLTYGTKEFEECTMASTPSGWVDLGDDTGWKSQQMKLLFPEERR